METEEKDYSLIDNHTGEVWELGVDEIEIHPREKPPDKEGKVRRYTCSNGKVIEESCSDLGTVTYRKMLLANIEELDLLEMELKLAEVGMMHTIAKGIAYQSNLFTIGKKTLFHDSEMAEYCKCDVKTFRRIAAKLKGEWIIVSIDGGYNRCRKWMVNPYLFRKGKYYNLATREIFCHYRIRKNGMTEWGKK